MTKQYNAEIQKKKKSNTQSYLSHSRQLKPYKEHRDVKYS